jgi:hypothetical protein
MIAPATFRFKQLPYSGHELLQRPVNHQKNACHSYGVPNAPETGKVRGKWI